MRRARAGRTHEAPGTIWEDQKAFSGLAAICGSRFSKDLLWLVSPRFIFIHWWKMMKKDLLGPEMRGLYPPPPAPLFCQSVPLLERFCIPSILPLLNSSFIEMNSKLCSIPLLKNAPPPPQPPQDVTGGCCGDREASTVYSKRFYLFERRNKTNLLNLSRFKSTKTRTDRTVDVWNERLPRLLSICHLICHFFQTSFFLRTFKERTNEFAQK